MRSAGLSPASEAGRLVREYGHRAGEEEFFISDTPPGKGPSLHTHPYAEVFVVQEGELTFTVGGDTVETTGGQIAVAPAGTPHKFTNTGPGRARHIDIHTSARMYTEWLEEGA